MPRYLVDLDVRATGRSPLHLTPNVEAETMDDAVEQATRILATMIGPEWDDADITTLSMSVDRLAEEPKP